MEKSTHVEQQSLNLRMPVESYENSTCTVHYSDHVKNGHPKCTMRRIVIPTFPKLPLYEELSPQLFPYDELSFQLSSY